MELALPTVIIMSFFIGVWWIMHSHYRREHAKRNLPERAEYAAAHGGEWARCHGCGATELKDDGLDSGQDSKRVVSCLSCGILLHRYLREE